MVRDMTRSQFHAALDRNGFKRPVLAWVQHRSIPGVHFSVLLRIDGKIARRATIAHLIRRRNEELAKMDAKL